MSSDLVGDSTSRWISSQVDYFVNATVKEGDQDVSVSQYLDDTIQALAADSSNPAKLAEYQKALMIYTLHMNSQSSVIKTIKDTDTAIVHNFV